MAINANALTPASSRKRAEYEKIIKEGIKTFYKVGHALIGMREEKLYLSTHATFKEYCEDVWDFSDQYARNLIDASETRQLIEESKNQTIVGFLPTTESQARHLKAPKGGPCRGMK
jgi:hypothetical protein